MRLNSSSLERESITVGRTLNNGLLKDRLLEVPHMQKKTVWPEIMSLKIIGYVVHSIYLPPTQKLVLIVLADFYNEKCGKAWPSQDTLCDVTGLSLRSINRALSELKKGAIYNMERAVIWPIPP